MFFPLSGLSGVAGQKKTVRLHAKPPIYSSPNKIPQSMLFNPAKKMAFNSTVLGGCQENFRMVMRP